MNHSLKTGFSFGLTSGVITTLGLMVGLESSTGSRLAVIGGILTIAIVDALSDALGIHISEEAENKHTQAEIWQSTLSTFFFKFMVALTFIVPVLLLDLSAAIIASIVWGLLIVSLFSFILAKNQKTSPLHVVGEHLIIAVVVIVLTHYLGAWISSTFA